MILRWLAYSLLNFVIVLLAYPVVPLAVLLADKEGRLPKYLRWFETHDDLGWGAGTYEHPIGEAYRKYGKRVALIFWLWRNKAYTFRNSIRATPDYGFMRVNSYGATLPPKFGPYASLYTVSSHGKTWFDLFVGFSFFKFFIYLRMGWKVKPIVEGQRPGPNSATGMFSGISIRSDDWDDFAISEVK